MNTSRNGRKILLTLVMLFTFFLMSAHAQDVPEMLDDLRRSVVHIYALGYGEDGTAVTRWTGTGFAVGIAGEETDVFLTNWHVVTCSGRFDSEHVRFWILRDDARFLPNREPEPESGAECEVLKTTDGFPDTAVIRTLEPVSGFPALPLRSSRQVKDGTAVYSLGFPGMKETHYGADSGPEDVAVTAGFISDHMTMTQAENTRAIIHTAVIEHGNSGGPLVDAEGTVVAQNTYGFEESVTTKYFCAVYIDYAMQLLDELGLPYTAVPGMPELYVLVADTLHLPNLSLEQAYLLATLGVILAALFVCDFLKITREAAAELREKFAPRESPMKEMQEISQLFSRVDERRL